MTLTLKAILVQNYRFFLLSLCKSLERKLSGETQRWNTEPKRLGRYSHDLSSSGCWSLLLNCGIYSCIKRGLWILFLSTRRCIRNRMEGWLIKWKLFQCTYEHATNVWGWKVWAYYDSEKIWGNFIIWVNCYFRIEKPHITKKHVHQCLFIKLCLPVCLCHQCAACFGQFQMTAAFVCMDSTFSLSVFCVSSRMFIPTDQMTPHLKNKVRRLCWVVEVQ